MSQAIQDYTLPVMEHFYTLQGEGAYAGHAAYFVRLGGCDVGCFWCDVKESWDAANHPQMTVEAIVQAALQFSGRLVVITGGEPSLHDLRPLTDALHAAGFRIHIETSASSPLLGNFDWITISPKKFKAALEENLPLAHELKVIVYNQHDLQWAVTFEKHLNKQCQLFLQAEWDKRSEMTPLVIEFIKQNPRWQLSVQTHKYLNIP